MSLFRKHIASANRRYNHGVDLDRKGTMECATLWNDQIGHTHSNLGTARSGALVERGGGNYFGFATGVLVL